LKNVQKSKFFKIDVQNERLFFFRLWENTSLKGVYEERKIRSIIDFICPLTPFEKNLSDISWKWKWMYLVRCSL